MSRVIQCYLGADLRSGHEGLSALARKDGIKVEELGPGEYVLFINNKKDKLKLYACSEIVAYLKLDEGRKLNMATIAEIPKAFRAKGRIDYEGTLRDTLTKALARKNRLSVSEQRIA